MNGFYVNIISSSTISEQSTIITSKNNSLVIEQLKNIGLIFPVVTKNSNTTILIIGKDYKG